MTFIPCVWLSAPSTLDLQRQHLTNMFYKGPIISSTVLEWEFSRTAYEEKASLLSPYLHYPVTASLFGLTLIDKLVVILCVAHDAGSSSSR